MKILRLKVDGLFGLYDYAIDFQQELNGLSVITSPNGYGKTTLLRMINSLSSQRLYYLFTVKFKYAEFLFDNGQRIAAIETFEDNSKVDAGDNSPNQQRELRLIWLDGESELCRFEFSSDSVRQVKSFVLSQGRISRVRPIYDSDFEDDAVFVNGEYGQALIMELAKQQEQEQFLLLLLQLGFSLPLLSTCGRTTKNSETG